MAKLNLLNMLGKLGLSKTSDGQTKTSGGLQTFLNGLKEKVKLFGKTESSKILDTFHKVQDNVVGLTEKASSAADETNMTMPIVRIAAGLGSFVLLILGIRLLFKRKTASSTYGRK